jgi:integrase
MRVSKFGYPLMALTDAKIRSTKPGALPIKLTDGAGLYLEVRPTGAKLWRYRYRIAGKENLYAVGGYPQISLTDARTERDKARALVKQGIHPAHTRQARVRLQVAENANTFEAIAREWIEKRGANWSAYYLKQVENMLSGDAYPYIGNLPMRSIVPAHLLEIVGRVENRGAVTVAILLRQWMSAIFRYAVSTSRADTDPAAALKGAIHRPKVEHSKPLTQKQIPDFLKSLATYGGYRTTAIAIRLLMLTFVRTIELRGAEWAEFDLDRAEWRIPAGRMKMGEPHIVPLSSQAVELLRELHTLTGGRKFLFPNYRRPTTYMTATTINRALERMGYGGKFSGHGFRATASTMLNELGYRSDLIESQLAHAERSKVRASYNHAQYLPERKAMMQAWSDLIDEMANDKSNVTPIKARPAA